MNGPGDISERHEQQLLDCYLSLQELAAYCDVPAVRAAARLALAELYPAVEGQLIDFNLYSHRWQTTTTSKPVTTSTPTATPTTSLTSPTTPNPTTLPQAA